MQRWALLLSVYQYVISYRSTQEYANTQIVSQDYPCHRKKLLVTHLMLQCTDINVPPVTSDAIKTATRTDPILGAVLRYTQSCWPLNVSPEMKPYWARREAECFDVGNSCNYSEEFAKSSSTGVTWKSPWSC